eukprot:gene5165-5684_t
MMKIALTCSRSSRSFYSVLTHPPIQFSSLASTYVYSSPPSTGFGLRLKHTFARDRNRHTRNKWSKTEMDFHGKADERFVNASAQDLVEHLQELKLKDGSSTSDLEEITECLKDLSLQARGNVAILNECLPWLEVKAQQLPSSRIGTWIASLSRIGLRGHDSTHKKLVSLTMKKLCEAEGLSEKELSMTFTGLRVAQIRSVDFPPGLEISLSKEVQRVANELDVGGISNILFALPKLGLTARFISPETRAVLLKKLLADAGNAKSKDLALSIYSLGLLGVSMNVLEESERLIVDELVQKAVKTFDASEGGSLNAIINQGSDTLTAQGLAMMLHGLGGMYCKWDTLSEASRNGLETTLQSRALELTEQELSMVIDGLGGMSATWSTLSDTTRSNLEAVIQFRAYDFTAQGLPMTMHGLGDMSAQWDTLSELTRSGLEAAVQLRAKELSLQGIAMTFHGLGGMSAKWDTLSEITRNTLDGPVLRRAKEFTAQGLATVVHGLGRMSCGWSTLSGSTRRNLEAAIENRAKDAKGPQVFMIFHGLGKMSADWHSLPEAVRNSLEEVLQHRTEDFTARGLAMVLYGLGGMYADWNTLPATIRGNLEKGITRHTKDFSVKVLTMAMHGLSGMSATLSEDVRTGLIDSLKNHKNTIRHPYLKVMRTTTASGLN